MTGLNITASSILAGTIQELRRTNAGAIEIANALFRLEPLVREVEALERAAAAPTPAQPEPVREAVLDDLRMALLSWARPSDYELTEFGDGFEAAKRRVVEIINANPAPVPADGQTEGAVARKDPYEFALEWRCIDPMADKVCKRCYGAGTTVYGSTSTWRGGIGGQAMTADVCDQCWGSGLADKPWPSHRAHPAPSAAAAPAWVAGGEALHREQIRVAAVAAIRAVTGCPDIIGRDGNALSESLMDALDGMTYSAAAPSAPRGWRLVPKEPTTDMYRAFIDAVEPGVWDESSKEVRAKLAKKAGPMLRAFINAAPAAPTAGEKE